MFNKYHSKLWDLGNPHKSDNRDVEFGGTQIFGHIFLKMVFIELELSNIKLRGGG
jgi:hypothetical protein